MTTDLEKRMNANVKRCKVIVLPAEMRKHYKGARAHLEIGFTRIGGQEAYFHALAGVEYKLGNNHWESRYGRFACCADHDALRAHFPDVAHLTRWHLAAINTGPMHYEANALYWADLATGRAEPSPYQKIDPVDAFKSTVAWGALEDDTGEPWKLEPRGYHEETNAHGQTVTVARAPGPLHEWLRARLPRLMVAFKRDIDAAFPGMWDAGLALPPGRF